MLKDAGEQVDASAHVLLLIEFDFDLPAAHKANSILGNNACEVALRFQIQEAGDLFFVKRGFAKIVEAQHFRQSIFAFVHQRQIVQGEMRDKTPEDALARRRSHRRGWLADR